MKNVKKKITRVGPTVECYKQAFDKHCTNTYGLRDSVLNLLRGSVLTGAYVLLKEENSSSWANEISEPDFNLKKFKADSQMALVLARSGQRPSTLGLQPLAATSETDEQNQWHYLHDLWKAVAKEYSAFVESLAAPMPLAVTGATQAV